MKKIKTGINVFDAAIERLDWVFQHFDNICLSFSGGKDSTVLFHLAVLAAKKNCKKFNVLFIDWEAQYTATIDHIHKVKEKYSDFISEFYWVALPLTTTNSVSQYNPEWICWEEGVDWVRVPPEEAITSHAYFPFYKYAMTFEEFVSEFSEWIADGKSVITLIGIRTEESLYRYLALVSKRKLRFERDKPWTTVSLNGLNCLAYPLYDWSIRDIWIFIARYKLEYNPLYDLMYYAGVSFKNMRVCEPFGTEQRRGLWLFHVLEPELWEKICNRVSGATSGAIYANQTGDYFCLKQKISKPNNHTWRSYVFFLLENMPQKTAEHYRNKIAVYIRWYQKNGYPVDIPDEQEKDLGYKDIPSWRRICKTIIKNDFWCRRLSFSPTKSDNYENHFKRIKDKRKQWDMGI